MERSPHILIVDDDVEIHRLLNRLLQQYGFRVTVAGDGRAMRKALADWQIDLVVLDVMLPGEDGFALCRAVRQTSRMPIIMLTAVAGDADRILGLELGADDYLVKPFNPRELVARIRAVLRRAETPTEAAPAPAAGARLRFAGWELSVGGRELRAPDGTVVHLSTGEFQLLTIFLANPQRILTRDQLVDRMRGQSTLPFDRSIDIQVSRLRRKIEGDPREPGLIKTVRGQGYQFCAEVEALA